MTILVTGGLGFLGSCLSRRALESGEKTVVLDNFSKGGAAENLKWLQQAGKPILERADISSFADVQRIFRKHKPDAVFHVAGQVAMTTSIKNPRLDFDINALGTFNVLEASRLHAPDAAVLYSSTNKVYGDLSDYPCKEAEARYTVPAHPDGFDERVPLEFHSPYGCSKGAADQYALDYHRIFGLGTVVFRHSSIYGERQFSTADQGWVGWFISEALKLASGKKKKIEIHGNGKQVRDLLYVSDAVELYFSCWKSISKAAGQAFNIGGGMENSLSLLELFSFLEAELGAPMPYVCREWRESDQKVFVADTKKIRSAIGWRPKVGKDEGLRMMIDWCRRHG